MENPKVTATISYPTVGGTAPTKTLSVNAVTKGVKVDWESVPRYDGATNITPSTEPQTLLTQGKAVLQNIIINPIPNNYGLVEYNGAYLTVS